MSRGRKPLLEKKPRLIPAFAALIRAGNYVSVACASLNVRQRSRCDPGHELPGPAGAHPAFDVHCAGANHRVGDRRRLRILENHSRFAKVAQPPPDVALQAPSE